jgi:predicted dehydrogenase
MSCLTELKQGLMMKKSLKYALIGPGRMGINYASIIQKQANSSLIAICGNRKKSTIDKTSDFSVPLYFNGDWKNMLDEHSEIDCVIIASPEWEHFEPFNYCVANNKKVILEKPVAINSKQIQSMKKLAFSKNQKSVAVCFTSRFDPRLNFVKNKISSGVLGNIGYIYSRRNADIKTIDRIYSKMPIPFWLIVHDIDIMRFLTNSEVISVYASQKEINKKRVVLTATLSFKNGTEGIIESVCFTDDSSNSKVTAMDIELEKGRFEINFSQSGVELFQPNTTFERPDLSDFQIIHDEMIGNTPAMINHFASCFELDNTPATTFYDGWMAAKVSEAIDESIKKQKKVEITYE